LTQAFVAAIATYFGAATSWKIVAQKTAAAQCCSPLWAALRLLARRQRRKFWLGAGPTARSVPGLVGGGVELLSQLEQQQQQQQHSSGNHAAKDDDGEKKD